jgi:hypothetical protein
MPSSLSEQPGHKGAQEMNEQQKTRILSGFLNGMVEVRGIELGYRMNF